MRKLHVAVDLDDVVLDFMAGVFSAFEREYGVRPEYDQQPWGSAAVEFTRHPMFLESGYQNWWGWLRDREWLWATFGTVPGAIGGIKRLRAAGHYVECVTSKPEWAEHNVWKWLGRWRPAFHAVTIVTAGDRKVDFTDADVLVDDKPQNCVEFMEVGRHAVLFDRSQRAEHCGAYTARDWESVVKVVGFLAEHP